ncbi:hypothetical protein HNP99_001290 [Flavobacterium sp. 28A]|uniref:hypothetical protein n=1 Tax=Flavobacterium sp. 28A TaxID=2735895 RepID=UPI001C2D53A9|nr:hypothetical protein [Flavobacterium sp. 28A]NRT14946.1 hypothetical protein [Flavobacterium sp. 28A]
MKNLNPNIIKIISVVALRHFLGLPSPLNLLSTIIDHSNTFSNNQSKYQKLLLDFYNISIKRSFKVQLKYGNNNYDFNEGTMSFMAPNQIIAADKDEERKIEIIVKNIQNEINSRLKNLNQNVIVSNLVLISSY